MLCQVTFPQHNNSNNSISCVPLDDNPIIASGFYAFDAYLSQQQQQQVVGSGSSIHVFTNCN